MRAHVTVAKPIGRIAITVPKGTGQPRVGDRKSTRLNSSHGYISYAVFCLKKKTAVHGLRPCLHAARAAAALRRPAHADGACKVHVLTVAGRFPNTHGLAQVGTPACLHASV